MTKRELNQLCCLNKEIENQKLRLLELDTAATNITTVITGMPRGNMTSDKISRYAAEIADLRGLIELNTQKCYYELNRLTRYINSIKDSQMRLILSLRYINGLCWQQIAFSIGKYDESYPRRKHNKFLKESENKIELI